MKFLAHLFAIWRAKRRHVANCVDEGMSAHDARRLWHSHYCRPR